MAQDDHYVKQPSLSNGRRKKKGEMRKGSWEKGPLCQSVSHNDNAYMCTGTFELAD